LTACGAAPGLRSEKDAPEACGGYPAIALYQLPYDTAQPRQVVQGNCGAHTNKGPDRYAYEFAMPVGTAVHAARSGTVRTVDAAGVVEIVHADLTWARYAALSVASVEVGDYVAAGSVIAQSGATGFVSQPLLRFEVMQLEDGAAESVPLAFTDAGTVVQPLTEGQSYP
jgi:murein DD-endopeptidase MepM/ murein hydrolase activator NlpD